MPKAWHRHRALRLVSLTAVFVVLGPAASARAVVPGTEGDIAFDSTRDGNAEIYRMKADGSGQTRLTADPASDENPAWSPEGNRIAFASTKNGNSEIYVMSFDGSGQTRLTTNPAVDSNATWSPDGAQIAFQTNRDGNNEIYRMNADGSGQTRLTNDAASDFRPSWSPDGTKIAFGSSRDANQEIYSMNADGSGQTRLTNNAAVDAHPAWLSNGSQLAFVRTGDIFRINADGGGETRLTTSANNSDPAGSPGDRIVFRSSRDGNSEIYVMGADGSAQTRLTVNAANDATPDWQGRNRPPTCQNLNQTTQLNTATTADITCTDPDGNPLSYVIGSPGNGAVTGFTQVPQASGTSPFLQPPGRARFTYTPTANFLGSDAIAFTATDARGGFSNIALLSMQVAFPPPPVRPEVTGFRFSPKSLAAGKGGVFAYSLSATARVKIEIERQAKGRLRGSKCSSKAKRGTKCTIFQFRTTLTKNAIGAGANTLSFNGKVGGKALKAGSYLATITPFDAAGEPGLPHAASFKVVRKKKKKKSRGL